MSSDNLSAWTAVPAVRPPLRDDDDIDGVAIAEGVDDAEAADELDARPPHGSVHASLVAASIGQWRDPSRGATAILFGGESTDPYM
jgi:hypothetical protein